MRKNSKREVGYLSYEDFKKLPLKRFREIAFHGWGEPLLHPDVFKMVSYANSLGIKTSLITNGVLLDKRVDEIFNSNLNSIAFGIFTLRGKQRVIENVQMFIEEKEKRKSKIETFVDITIFKDNLNEVEEIVKLCKEIGVDGVVLHRLFNLHNPSLNTLSKTEEKELFAKLKDVKGIKVYFPPKKHSIPCVVAKNCIYITWDCKQSPCCFLCEMGYVLGDAFSGDIFERHLRFLKEMNENEICRRCFW